MATKITYDDGAFRIIVGGAGTRIAGQTLIIVDKNGRDITGFDNEGIKEISEVDDPPIKTDYIISPCELCDCKDFTEAHMSDPMCTCRHHMSHHGMKYY